MQAYVSESITEAWYSFLTVTQSQFSNSPPVYISGKLDICGFFSEATEPQLASFKGLVNTSKIHEPKNKTLIMYILFCNFFLFFLVTNSCCAISYFSNFIYLYSVIIKAFNSQIINTLIIHVKL